MNDKTNKPLVILWLRRDLRLADNPTRAAAVAEGAAIIPLFIDEHGHTATRRLGAASKWWRGRSPSQPEPPAGHVRNPPR
ncbi:MAG: deoxyribodipyrimidine photo-lyase [Dongiaceae bacterium]